MEALVLNTNFQPVAIIDTFESFIWTDRYSSCGDFELYLPMNTEILDTVKHDYYLQVKDSKHLMIVEDIQISTDTEDGEHITITGRSIESILDRRIVWGITVLSGNLQEAIQKLLNDNLISPSNTDRQIPNFIFESSTDPVITALTIEAQYNGDDLLSVVRALCDNFAIGFQVLLNEQNKFVFSLYAGKDRSYDQSENAFVVFSPKFDNITNSSYLESKKAMKNVTLVGGEGEGIDQTTATIGTASGLDRREIYTDASDTSSSTPEYLISQAEYQSELQQRGQETLNQKENTFVKAFEGKIDATSMFEYGKDFFVGDIVQLENEYGHKGKSYISEFVMSQDDTGISMYPTFESVA